MVILICITADDVTGHLQLCILILPLLNQINVIHINYIAKLIIWNINQVKRNVVQVSLNSLTNIRKPENIHSMHNVVVQLEVS